ncbi:MAG: SIMPL domain-containing protein [Roseibium sp.]
MRTMLPAVSAFPVPHVRRLGLAVSLAAAMFSAPAAYAEETSTRGSITMEGRGSVSVAPDMAVITTRVVTAAKTAPDALAQNTRDLSKVIETIKAADIEAKDIQTSGFSIYPRYERITDGSNRQPEIIGYEVRNGVEINVRDLGTLGNLLNTVVESGANAVDGIRFQVSDPDEKLDEARKAAVKAARHKAEIFSNAAGVELVNIITIAETGVQMPRPMMMRAESMMMAKADAVPIEAGEETISASVTISWEITTK